MFKTNAIVKPRKELISAFFRSNVDCGVENVGPKVPTKRGFEERRELNALASCFAGGGIESGEGSGRGGEGVGLGNA